MRSKWMIIASVKWRSWTESLAVAVPVNAQVPISVSLMSWS